MKQRTGDGDVTVDAREDGRDRADSLGHGQGMLEQAVGVRLVIVLGCRGVPVVRPAARALAEDGVEQPAQMWVLDGGDELAQVGLHLLEIADRAVDELASRVFVGRRRPQAVDVELRAVTGVDRELAGRVDNVTGPAQLAGLGHVFAHDGRHAPGAVPQPQAEEFAALSADPRLGFAYQQGLGNLRTVCELLHLHGITKIEWPADS